MKILVNKCYGGFELNDEALTVVGPAHGLDDIIARRRNAKLIAMVASGVNISGRYADIVAVEIPDNATDYRILEYDGFETVYYVVDGKIHTA